MVTYILGALIVLFLIAVIVQIARLTELVTAVKGEKETEYSNSKLFGWAMLGLLAFVLIISIGQTIQYKHMVLNAATEHFAEIQKLFNITFLLTGIVFLATHVVLFYFAYKYRLRKNPNVLHFDHSSKLEFWWTIIPSFVLTFLVVSGLVQWNKIMSPSAEKMKNAINVEATAYQFGWAFRYPGNDKEFGKRNFRLIGGANLLGQDWNDKANLDDIMPNDLVLPVGKFVHVKITSRDVLHNFYIPHFGTKMDAVPGMPTQFSFTATKTTEQMRKEMNNPNFEYELACAELCGKGHFSMRKIVKVVTPEEYEAWLKEQKSYYDLAIKGTDEDPFKFNTTTTVAANDGESTEFDLAKLGAFVKKKIGDFELNLPEFGVENKVISFIEDKNKVVDKTTWFSFDRLLFETGSAKLKPQSEEQLNNMAQILKTYPNVEIKLGGYTDNVGDDKMNLDLSQKRAESVKAALVAKSIAVSRISPEGYGETHPVASNDTPEGRAQNRRIDIRITKK